MSAPEGGRTRRDNLQAKLKGAASKNSSERIAKLEAELELPEFPEALRYLWIAYFRLRRRMAGGFAGPNPIGWQDLDAFVRQSGLRLAAWELTILETLDDLYLGAATAAKQAPAPNDKGVIETASMQDGKAVKSLLRSIGKRRGKNKKGERPNV